MKMLEGKVAAVTGAASGLGRAMGLAFAGEGMHAALADVDDPGLKITLNEVQSRGVRAFAMRVDVSVLCPAYVPTGIADSERNRPRELLNPAKSPSKEETMLKKAVASGKLSADDVARVVVAAVKEERFYVLTHPRIKGAIRARM